MSIEATALLLREGVEVEEYIESISSQVNSYLQDIVVEQNCQDFIKSYDNAYIHGSFNGTFSQYMKNITRDAYDMRPQVIILFGKYTNGETLVLYNGSHKLFKTLLKSELVDRDVSCYTGTDDQIASGELTPEEWDKRKEFWYAAKTNYWPRYNFRPFIYTLNLAERIIEKYETSFGGLEKRNEVYAKQCEIDHLIKEIQKTDKNALEHFFSTLKQAEEMRTDDSWKAFTTDLDKFRKLE